jgi:hypothetical protein
MSTLNSVEKIDLAVGTREIKANLSVAADAIREFTMSQAQLWQQLPYLALQVDGNSGFSSSNQKLYEYGLLHIASHNMRELTIGLYGLFVDCESGRLLSLSGDVDASALASDQAVLDGWTRFSGRFNAQHHLDYFVKAASKPHFKYSSLTEGEAIAWRQEIIQRVGLAALYSRTQIVEE